MAKKNENRSYVALKCTKCGEVRLRTSKNKKKIKKEKLKLLIYYFKYN